jgi:hypothetical protein
VHTFTFQNHPGALKEGRIFDCETDVVVCSRAHGMGLAYPLEQDAHVKDHCERVEANPGMKMKLPFNLGPTSKDQDLLSIAPRVIPDFGLGTSASGEQAEFEDDRKKGEYGTDDSAVSGKHTASQMGTGSEEDDQAKSLRVAAEAAGGLSSNIDFGEGPASSKGAKKSSKERRRPKRRVLGSGGRDSSKELFGPLTPAPLGDSLILEVFVAPALMAVLRRFFPTAVCEECSAKSWAPVMNRARGGTSPCCSRLPAWSLRLATSATANNLLR